METFKEVKLYGLTFSEANAQEIESLKAQDFKQDELAETSFYHGYGVNIQAIHNWVSGVTQYYITDINA